MSYRFNNGSGGVTCDICQVLIDSNLSYQEYVQSYGLASVKDICWECKEKRAMQSVQSAQDVPIDKPVV